MDNTNTNPDPNANADENEDPSLLLLLSNLLHLHSYLDTYDSSSPLTNDYHSSSSTAPVLFLALSSTLSLPTPPLQIPSSPPLLSLPPSKYPSHLGLSHPLFLSLHQLLLPFSPSFHPLPLPLALPLALHRLSQGLPSNSLAHTHQIPSRLLSKSTHALTRILSTSLYPQFLHFPPPTNLKIPTSLPGLLGAVASSPVRILVNDNLSLSSSRRSFPSVLLQAVADRRKVFLDACVIAPGSSDPASHLRDSQLYARLVRAGAGGLGGRFLVGDSSYPLLPFLMTPFGGGDEREEVFDGVVGRERAESVEAAIGLLKGRWKILRNLNVGLDHAAQTVVACVVLHNMCQLAGESEDEGRYVWRDPPESPQPAGVVESEREMYRVAVGFRESLADGVYERQRRSGGGR